MGPILLVLIEENLPQQQEGNHDSLIKGVLYLSDDATCFFQSESPFVYQVINITNLT